MPRSQKDASGLCTLMVQYADQILYRANLVSDYSSRKTRESQLRELNIILNHMKELIITASERGYITKRSTMDHLATKVISLSDRVIGFAQGLENQANKKPKATATPPEETAK